MAEVKFVDLWASVQRPHVGIQVDIDLLVAQRKIGRRCDFLEDVSEDVHFDWEFLGDVNFIQ